jgi:hypothetical protein
LAFFLAWEIYDICPFIDPSHDGVAVPFINLFDYFSFNLIAQQYFICEETWNHKKITKKDAWSSLPLFFKMLRINCPKQLELYTSKRKGKKNKI